MEEEQEEQLLHGRGGLLLHPTITSTLSLPLTRYTSRLFACDHHQIFLGDSAEPRSDDSGYGDRPAGENCAYSKPIVVLDLIWNLAFVVVSVVVLLSTLRERPSTPLRVWLCGYALQCVLHVGFVYLEYQNRNDDDHHHHRGIDGQLPASHSHTHSSSIAKRSDSVNTIISSIWWVLGFYWLVLGGQTLLQDSPRLYWLTVVFLAFDVFYIVFCVGMACIIFIALLCCIPVMAIAYAVRIREGASEDDIRALPKYRFCQENPWVIFDNDKKPNVLGARAKLGFNNCSSELALPPKDSGSRSRNCWMGNTWISQKSQRG